MSKPVERVEIITGIQCRRRYTAEEKVRLVEQSVHLTAQRLHRDQDAEILPQPLAEIAQMTAHNAMDRRLRPAVYLRGQRLAVCVDQQRRGAGRLAVDQLFRTLCVEPSHPVPHDLQGNIAKLRRAKRRRPAALKSGRSAMERAIVSHRYSPTWITSPPNQEIPQVSRRPRELVLQ